jgi:putative membrane protein
MYDRLVHFSFGLLLVYPIREFFMRISQTKGFWSYWFPIELIVGLSGIFEIIEWLAAITFNPEVGLAYVGAQGDIWDAQKDMALATIGSIITMFIVFLINLTYRKNHIAEIKESLSIQKDDELLGEVKLSKMILQNKVKKSKKSLNT